MHFFRIRLVVALVLGITLISVGSTYFDVLAHKHSLSTDLVRRTQWYGAGLQPQIEQQMSSGTWSGLPGLLSRLRQHSDEPSLAVFNSEGVLLASSGDIVALKRLPASSLQRTLTAGKEASGFMKVSEAGSPSTEVNSRAADSASTRLWYEDALPLRDGQVTIGALVVLADAEYIRAEGMEVWRRSFLRVVAMTILVVVVTLAMVRWFLLRPITRATEWLSRLRQGKANLDEGTKEFGFLVPLANEVNSLAKNLARARQAAETEARLRGASENVWTADRLAVYARERLGNGKLFVVSNREPYMHERRGTDVVCVVPPSGLVTAIEPILRACDGTWIAHGSGGEDKAFVDEHDRLPVPPDDPHYTLRRVWLTPEEEAGYYEGFANEGLWPLCHIAHTRPIFRASDWNYYKEVNRKFCDVLVKEMQDTEHPVVFVQDYHFALLPKMIKNARPDARVAIFWHIPWPNPEAFGICPWQAELLDGLLGANLIGFHIQSHCNNFLDTVDRVLESRSDWEHFSIRRNNQLSLVRPYPISVAWNEHATGTVDFRDDRRRSPQPLDTVSANGRHRLTSANQMASGAGAFTSEITALRRELGVEGRQMILGVDRMDYTKGIVERLLALEYLLEEHPWYIEKVVLVQIAAPSRTHIPSYAALQKQVEETVERINRRFEKLRWKPVMLIERQNSHDEVERYYRAADVCLVTSLHDGMNLVAKEFLAARNDGDGVLILSRFTGAAQELRDALLVNPYDTQQVGEAIRTALEMNVEERRLRMERMRHQVREHNVYRWASNVLTDLCAVQLESEALGSWERMRHRLAS